MSEKQLLQVGALALLVVWVCAQYGIIALLGKGANCAAQTAALELLSICWSVAAYASTKNGLKLAAALLLMQNMTLSCMWLQAKNAFASQAAGDIVLGMMFACLVYLFHVLLSKSRG